MRPETDPRGSWPHNPWFVHQMKVGPWDNFVYLVGTRATRRCFVVDPAWELKKILGQLEALDLTPAGILCTHSHFDHVDKVEAMLEHHDIPVHMLAEEVDFSGFRCENLKAESAGATLTLSDDPSSPALRLLHTPGHTPGSVCFRIEDNAGIGAVITGDTLFVSGCGRCDFVGGDPPTMHATLHRMLNDLPATTRIFPGHDYGATPVSTVDVELKENPWLQHPTVEDFVRHRMDGKTPGTVIPKPEWDGDA